MKDVFRENPKRKFGVAIGNFDGIHLGHQSFLRDACSHCSEKGLDLIVITFVPHPRKILRAASGFLINSYRDRRDLLEKYGVNSLLEIEFTRDFSTLSPDEFLDNYIFFNEGVRTLF